MGTLLVPAAPFKADARMLLQQPREAVLRLRLLLQLDHNKAPTVLRSLPYFCVLGLKSLEQAKLNAAGGMPCSSVGLAFVQALQE